MDTEYSYPLTSNDGILCRAIIGWSDTAQEYYACIETNTEYSDILWKHPPNENTSDIRLIAQSLINAAVSLTLDKEFQLCSEDIETLFSAPRQRLVAAAEIEHLNMLDTDYAKAPFYGSTHSTEAVHHQIPFDQFLDIIDGGRNIGLFRQQEQIDDLEEINDLEQMVTDSFFELQTCVSCLRQALDYSTTADQRCEHILLFTVCELIRINESLNCSFSSDRIHAVAIASESTTDTINDVFNSEEIDRVNTLTVSLCGSKLTDFKQAIERGYDPTTGLPLDCPTPQSFNWAATVGEDAVELYQQYGLSLDDAQHMVDIERTDPRYREPEAWAFLETTAQRLMAIHEQRHEGME